MTQAHGQTTDDRSLQNYQTRAETIAREVTERWRATDPEDIRSLTDAVYNALVEEANLELRQILASLGGQLELAMGRVARDKPAFTLDKLAQLRGSVARASTLMEVFLDRASASKLIIQIEPEQFDLSKDLETFVTQRALGDVVQMALEPCPVEADRQKLVETVGHLITRFYFAARPHERVLLSVRVNGNAVEGFVGLSPSHLRLEELMEEIRLPLSVEDIGVDIAYARAVLDRHGGTLFVGTAGDASAGFGFTLPIRKEAC